MNPSGPRALRLGSALLLAVGFVGGFLDDPRPARPVVHRAGYRVLEADFHVHTNFSDGSLTPFGVLRQAARRGLDVIAVTEHNSAWPGFVARAWSRFAGGPLVLSGQEVTTRQFHIIALNISGTVSPDQPAGDVVREIHARGGMAIAAHPVSRFWPALLPIRDELDGAEVMHPLAYAGAGRAGWHWPEMVEFYQGAHVPLTAIGSSDYHWGSVLGLCRTLVFVREPVAQETVLFALREHRTVVIDREGKMYGDPTLVAALEREPLADQMAQEEADADYRYHGSSPRDRVCRTLGWLGLLGFFLFGSPSLRPWRQRLARQRPGRDV